MKKQNKKTWVDEHIIFEMEGLTKKQNKELRDKILKKVADKFVKEDVKKNERGV